MNLDLYRAVVEQYFRPLGPAVPSPLGAGHVVEGGVYFPQFNGALPAGPLTLELPGRERLTLEADLAIPGLGTALRAAEANAPCFQRESRRTAQWLDDTLGPSPYEWDTLAVQRGVLAIVYPYLLVANDFRRARFAHLLVGPDAELDGRLGRAVAIAEYLFLGNAMATDFLTGLKPFRHAPRPSDHFHGHLVTSAGHFLHNYALKFQMRGELELTRAEQVRLHQASVRRYVALAGARGARLGWEWKGEAGAVPAEVRLNNAALLRWVPSYRCVLELIEVLYPATGRLGPALRLATQHASACEHLLDGGDPALYAHSWHRLMQCLGQVDAPKRQRDALCEHFEAALPAPTAAPGPVRWEPCNARPTPVSRPAPARTNPGAPPPAQPFEAMKQDLGSYYARAMPFVRRGLEQLYPRDASLRPFLDQLEGLTALELEAVQAYVFDPVQSYLDRGGKMLRSVLTAMVLEAYGYDLARAEPLLASIELQEDSTIMVDDVHDDSETRRGGPSGQRLYNPAIALNAGASIFVHSIRPVLERELDFSSEAHLKAVDSWAWETIQMALAQCIEIVWTLENCDDVRESAYLQETIGRCAFLSFRGELRWAALLAGAPAADLEALSTYGEEVLIVYHLRGDCLDLMPEDSQWGKVRAEDITTGRRTYLLIDALAHAAPAARMRLAEILRLHTRDEALLREAVELIRSAGSFERTRARIEQAAARCDALVAGLHVPESYRALLRAFTAFCAERKK